MKDDPTLADIEMIAGAYSAARADLAKKVEQRQSAVAAVDARHMPDIRFKAAVAESVKEDLHNAVAARRDLFKRPKTRILHGIRVGWKKQKGKVTVADPARVVKAIRKHLPRKFKTLVKVTETPVKTELNKLAAADLRKLGVSVGDAGDAVTIAPVDSDVEKLVQALLDGAKDGEAAR